MNGKIFVAIGAGVRTRSERMRSVLGVASLLLAVGCKTLPFPEPDLEGPYGQVLAKWTRKASIYAGLETRGFCRIVYLSSEMVEAQAKEISAMRAELPDQAQRTLDKLRRDNATPTFFAIFYTPDKISNDWNEKNSVWRIALNFGLGQVEPQRIERFERPYNAELRHLYPYLDDYSIGYAIHFPAQQPPASEQFTAVGAQVIIAGAPGKMEFVWELARPSARN